MTTPEQVLDAYDKLATEPGHTVRIWHLRTELGQPADFDEVLISMARDELVHLHHDRYKLSAEEHAAAVSYGGQMHLLTPAEGIR